MRLQDLFRFIRLEYGPKTAILIFENSDRDDLIRMKGFTKEFGTEEFAHMLVRACGLAKTH